MHDAIPQQSRPLRPPFALPPDLGAATRLPFAAEELDGSVLARFAKVARQVPDHVAIEHGEQTLTYAELDQRLDRVAAAILAQCGPGMETVALLFQHTPDSIVALLGALKAGKRYVALEPALAPATLRQQFADARPGLLLAQRGLQALGQDLAHDQAPVLYFDPDTLPPATCDWPHAGRMPSAPTDDAAILYTTGSTGRPKGIVHTHRSRLASSRRAIQAYHMGVEDRVAHVFSYAFGGAHPDMFGALLSGATLCMFDPRQQNMQALSTWLQAQRITLFHPPVTLFRELAGALSGAERFPHLRLIMLGGQTVRHEDVAGFRRCFQPPCLLANRLAATEFGVVAEYFVDHDLPIATETVPVGYATPGNQLLLVDDDGHILEIDPPGEPITGEIAVRRIDSSSGRRGVSEIPLRRPLPDPEGGERRIALSGDLGRMHADGLLEHLGRKDFMVKVRGYRVELAAIEAALRTAEGVKDAVVVAQDLPDGDRRLVAYVVPAASPPPTSPTLRLAVTATLPAYMAPAVFVTLQALPLTANGKVDRRSLPPPPATRPDLDVPYAAPATPLEAQLAGIWAEVLGVDSVGVHDPFLDLGGNSILAGRIAARIGQVFGGNFPLAAVLHHGAVAQQASAIARLLAQALSAAEVSDLLEQVERSVSDEHQ